MESIPTFQYSTHSVYKIIPLFLSFLLAYCTPSKSLYNYDYKLTEDIAYSSVSDMQLNIPWGWFTAEDTICKCIDIWLIRDDFSATLNVIPMNIDENLISRIEDDLKSLVNMSKSQKNSKLKNFISVREEDEYYEMNGKKIAAYEYVGDEGLPVRVVLFQYNNKFYEFSALPAEAVGKGKVNPEELFLIQNSVLSSIK